MSYDSIGRITAFRSRRGEQFTFAFDNLGRVTSVVVPERGGLDPTHTRDVFYGYDLMGNMEYARFDGTGGPGVTNTWNALGQLIASSTAMEGGARTLTYGYDAAGRLSSLQHPDGATFTYLYDVMNRPTTLRNPAAQNLVTWNYTAQGRLSSRTADNNAADTVYAYDTAGRLASLGLDHASATYDASWSFSYNPAGQIALETRTNDGFAFNAYATTNIAYVANNLNQYTSLTPTSGAASTITHDTNGNLTGDGTTTYVYDTENRLVYATNTSGTATLRYDPLGRLYEVTSPNGNKRRLFYSGQDLVVEYDGGSTMLGRYVHGLSGGDDPLVQYTGSSTALADTYFYASDPRGSIVLTGRIDGTNTTINAYDDYGVHSSGATGRFRYTGQAWVPEVGLLYYKARMYSPTLGRFMQTDPIGYADGMNMYAYVGNDPVNGVDPTGLADSNVIEVTSPRCRPDLHLLAFCGNTYIPPMPRGDWACQMFGYCGESNYAPPGDAPTGGGGDGSGGEGGAPENPDRQQKCISPGLRVRSFGNRVTIWGTVRGEGLTSSQLNRLTHAINERWSGLFGNYSVNTNIIATPSGSIPLQGSQTATMAGTIYVQRYPMYVQNLNPNLAGFENAAAHEFGHLLGLPDRYRRISGEGIRIDQGYEYNIMGNSSNRPSSNDISNVLLNANRC